MRTTYVLGAGASKAVWGLPVMSDFFACCTEAPRPIWLPPIPHLTEHVRARFGEWESANLEDVLTDIENTLTGIGSTWRSADASVRLEASLAKTELLQLVHFRLLNVDAGASGSAYEHVLEGLKENDTILTFNYDLGLDDFIEKNAAKPLAKIINGMILASYAFTCQQPPNPIMPSEHPGQGVLLKLHGSINYLCCPNASCPQHHSVLPDRMRRLTGAFCPVCGQALEVLLVPPSMAKVFDRFPRIGVWWRAALDALWTTERLVFWGYSCPPSDHNFAWLIRELRRPLSHGLLSLSEIHVIDPTAQLVRDRFQQLLQPPQNVTWRLWESHEQYAVDGEGSGRLPD